MGGGRKLFWEYDKISGVRIYRIFKVNVFKTRVCLVYSYTHSPLAGKYLTLNIHAEGIFISCVSFGRKHWLAGLVRYSKNKYDTESFFWYFVGGLIQNP